MQVKHPRIAGGAENPGLLLPLNDSIENKRQTPLLYPTIWTVKKIAFMFGMYHVLGKLSCRIRICDRINSFRGPRYATSAFYMEKETKFRIILLNIQCFQNRICNDP